MVKHCCAFGCSNEWKPGRDILFHKFPLKRPGILALWIKAVRLENFAPKPHTVLCSKHFIPDDYMECSGNRNYLKKDAVPSIFNFTKMQTHTIDQKELDVLQLEMEPPSSPPEPKFSPNVEVAVQTVPARFQTSSPERQQLARKVKTLKQQVKRYATKLEEMKNLVEDLRRNEKPDKKEAPTNGFEGASLELFQHKWKKNHAEYSGDFKQFCLTLYFYSPQAYGFVRETLGLPHRSTIHKWRQSHKPRTL